MNEEKSNQGVEAPPIPRLAKDETDYGKLSWIAENLLKNPLKVLEAMQNPSGKGIFACMLIINITCLIAYGLIVGSFSGGMQWYMSPLKIVAGMALTILFCFPSFYIFNCLGGVDMKPWTAFLLLLSSVSVFSILLVGFAPVAWVFSQSTATVFFIGFFHIAFWLVSTVFGMRVILRAAEAFKCKNMSYPIFWIVIFAITSLQMMTALRPLVGKSENILPKEKMFFLYHWGNLFSQTIDLEEKEGVLRR